MGKKYYITDLAFCFLSNPNSIINYRRTLKNIVYIYASSYDYLVSAGRIGKLEWDFILNREI